MPSLTMENYVKAIYKGCSFQKGVAAATGKLAEELGVSPGTVTSMLKTLGATELVIYTRYEGVRLTEAGKFLALRVLRRHRLIELFLVKTLDLSWNEVHEEVEHMEHAVRNFLIDRIDEFLGFPRSDPYGDPIPLSDGRLPGCDCERLDTCDIGCCFRLERVLDQFSEFLRYRSQSGFSLGVEGNVLTKHFEAGTMTVRVGETETTLGREASEKILVSLVGEPL